MESEMGRECHGYRAKGVIQLQVLIIKDSYLQNATVSTPSKALHPGLNISYPVLDTVTSNIIGRLVSQHANFS